MKLVITRVCDASVTIDGILHSEIANGLLILIGACTNDSMEDVRYLAKKAANMRIFPDGDGKLNLSVLQVGGSALCVSNFTLYADCSHGNRPSFIEAARPDIAEPLYNAFLEELASYGIEVKSGVFGADMKLKSTNNGPITIVIESRAHDEN